MLLEDLNHEFKREVTKEIIKTVISFSNTNGGKIYIGIDDSGEVLGVEDFDGELLKLTNVIRDGIKPDVTTFTSISYEIKNGKKIIVCEVQKGTSCPYYIRAKGIRPEGVYVRQGASSVPATQSVILKMIKETDGDSYEELRSLNQDLTFETLNMEFLNASIKLGGPQMKTLNIIDEDDLYSNLSLLLSDQCTHTIKAAVFEGTSKNLFKDRFEFSGSVIKQMKEVYEFIDRYNRTQSRIEGLNRIDVREYPKQALREALLNAIVHKDYSYGSSTLVSVYDDRIEILTIGGLVKGLIKEDIMIGTSILRNKNLANVFYRLRWIEAYGTGILRIKESYEKYDMQAKIEITDNAFKITLPAITIDRGSSVESVIFNSSEKKIIEMLKEQEVIKRKTVEAELSISQPMAVKLLKNLQEKNAIERIGNGKNIVYKLKLEKK